MFQRKKKWLKSIEDTIWFYILLLTGSLLFLRATFSYHPDTSGDFWGNVRIEFVGFCFDVLFLGLIFSLFMQRYQKKQNIQRWQEEIDDYRGWDEKEAVHRIVGNIRRLNRVGVTKFRLHFCHLQDANLYWVNLQGSDLSSSNLNFAYLQGSNLQAANCQYASLVGATLNNSILEKADLRGAKFAEAYFCTDRLFELPSASLEQHFVVNGNGCYPFLDGAIVNDLEWFEGLGKTNVKGLSTLMSVYLISQEGEKFVLRVKAEKRAEYNFFKALCSLTEMDERILAWSKKKHPELFRISRS